MNVCFVLFLIKKKEKVNWKLTVLQEYLHSPEPSDTVYILKPTAAVVNCLQITRWEKSTDKVKEFLQNKYNT